MDRINDRCVYIETYEGFDYYQIDGWNYAATWEGSSNILETDIDLWALKDYMYLIYW